MKKLLLSVLCALPIAATACGTKTVVEPPPPTTTPGDPTTPAADAPDPNAPVTQTVGATGGQIVGPGCILTIPAGALDADTDITITKSDEAVPTRHVGVTAVYSFTPAALKFKKAAKISFTSIPADAVTPVIGFKKADGIYEGQTTLMSGDAKDMATASITTLVNAFVATRDCGDGPGKTKAVCKAVPAPVDLDSRAINGFTLTGFEYWQWKKPDPYDGGNAVGWGYNGDGVPVTGVMPTDQARACMAEAFKVIEDILTAAPPQELKDLKTQHGVDQFWFWNNDMSDAKATVTVPKTDSELWLYDGSRGDGGLIKWINETERDGSCHLPTQADLITFAKACQTAFPGCGSGK